MLGPILFYSLIAPVLGIVCKCTGPQCNSDTCDGDYCMAAFIEASPRVMSRLEEPGELYIRGCAQFTPNSLASSSDLLNNCFDYDEMEFEHERRKICLCSSRLCNDGPLINSSLNQFRQHKCRDDTDCTGEYCLMYRKDRDQHWANKCVNRTVPLLDHLLLGIALTPAMNPTQIRFPGKLDRSESLLSPHSENDSFWGGNDIPEKATRCPMMLQRIEHRDEPEYCTPPKHGDCLGRFCIDIHFNVTTSRSYILERRYKGCVVTALDGSKFILSQPHHVSGCFSFNSPAANVSVCVSGANKSYITDFSLYVLLSLFYFCFGVRKDVIFE